MTGKKRNQDIGALHLLAAFFVMLGHQCALTGQNPILLFGCQIQAIGVKIIFLLTGFFVTKSLWNIEGTVGKVCAVYAAKRLKRIYPELFVCLIGTAFVIGPLFSSLGITDYFTDSVWFYLTANLRLYPVYALPGMFASNPYPNAVNGSLWTMPVEVLFYVLIFLIYGIGRTQRGRKTCYLMATSLMITGAMVRFLFFPADTAVFYGTDWMSALNIAPYLFIGGTTYLFDWKKYCDMKQAAFLFLATCGFCMKQEWRNEGLCLVVLSYFVLSFFNGNDTEKSGRGMFTGILKSEYAYGIYLWGFPIQQCLIQKLYVERAEPWNVWLIFSVSVVMTYMIAMLSYEWVYRRVVCRILTRK